MLSTACCLVVGLGLDLVSDWPVVLHAYVYYSPLSLSHAHRVVDVFGSGSMTTDRSTKSCA